MAKRFIDTEVWKKAWFRSLSPKMKCAWIFLCTNCDHAGVWEVDLETMTHFIGQRISLAEIFDEFKVVAFGDDKLFIPGFIAFQYGELDDDCRPHLSVVKRLKSLGLWDDSTNSYLTVSKQLAKGYLTLQDKDKDKDQDKVQDKNKDQDKEQKPKKADFEKLYKLYYPRKEGKDRGIERCLFQIKTMADLALLERSIKNYRTKCEVDKIEKKFIKHFSSFMSNWRECLDDDYGQADDFVKTPVEETLEQIVARKRLERDGNDHAS